MLDKCMINDQIHHVTHEINTPDTPVHLFFIHGGASDLSFWIKQFRYFKKYYNVTLIDLPGHGKSPYNGAEYTMGNIVTILFEFIRQHELKNIVLIGHSMGGCIAQRLVLSYPGHFLALVLLSTSTHFPECKKLYKKLKRDFIKTAELIYRSYMFTNNATAEYIQYTVNNIDTLNKRIVLNDYYVASQFNSTGEVRNITVPTLICCGENDRFVSKKQLEYLRKTIKGSKLVMYKNTGHMLPVEKNREVNATLNNFIKSLE